MTGTTRGTVIGHSLGSAQFPFWSCFWLHAFYMGRVNIIITPCRAPVRSPGTPGPRDSSRYPIASKCCSLAPTVFPKHSMVPKAWVRLITQQVWIVGILAGWLIISHHVSEKFCSSGEGMSSWASHRGCAGSSNGNVRFTDNIITLSAFSDLQTRRFWLCQKRVSH